MGDEEAVRAKHTAEAELARVAGQWPRVRTLMDALRRLSEPAVPIALPGSSGYRSSDHPY